MLLFPKPTKKPRRPKRRIASRSVFKEHGANPLKAYRRRFTDAKVMERAREAQRHRLADRTEAEKAMEAILTEMGVEFEPESIFLNGDRWVLVDIFLPKHGIAIELDGFHHQLQEGYDDGRSAWLLRRYGVRTVRFSNAEVFKEPVWVSARVMEALGMTHLLRNR